ncbi:SHOCT domain-containing protein [Streptomyces sp. NRRL F-4489]|uniref:SHOCT domain-containing protein n=1 Tax=Streptomyces sp. NRRL F-4489 TaxID=1609095 RepID=UPI00082C2BC5|nr:SHOCT domain-containing protein [Streptomyces sp. NRRL F-4489]
MMFWYGHGGGGWGWLAAMIGMVLFWALVITVGILVFRALARPGPPVGDEQARRFPGWHPGTQPGTPAAGPPGPEQILAERYARGEIEDEEYHRRLSVLRTSSHGGAGHGGAAAGPGAPGGEAGPGQAAAPSGPGGPGGPGRQDRWGGPGGTGAAGDPGDPGGTQGGSPPPA